MRLCAAYTYGLGQPCTAVVSADPELEPRLGTHYLKFTSDSFVVRFLYACGHEIPSEHVVSSPIYSVRFSVTSRCFRPQIREVALARYSITSYTLRNPRMSPLRNRGL